MRVTPDQVQHIKAAAQKALSGSPHRIWLFGSRANDSLRGGDIDLLVETDTSIAHPARAVCALYGSIVMALGERKIDVLLKDAKTPDAPVFQLARSTGVLL